MSLVQKLKPHLETIKVHKSPMESNPTERRLNMMAGIIQMQINGKITRAEADKRLKQIVAESQIEKALKDRGIKV